MTYVQTSLILLTLFITSSSVRSLQSKQGLPFINQFLGWLCFRKTMFALKLIQLTRMCSYIPRYTLYIPRQGLKIRYRVFSAAVSFSLYLSMLYYIIGQRRRFILCLVLHYLGGMASSRDGTSV